MSTSIIFGIKGRKVVVVGIGKMVDKVKDEWPNPPYLSFVPLHGRIW